MARSHLSREKLVKLVGDILYGGGTEEERDAWIERLEAAVDHPAPTNVLLRDRKYWRMGREKIELMVDELLHYTPICL